MRYFLDTEYNGYHGALISLALTPEFGDQEFYAILPLPGEIEPWVERNVLPYLNSAPIAGGEMTPPEAAVAVADYLARDGEALIVADWPEDIAHFCRLLTTGPGRMVDLDRIGFRLLRSTGFSASARSAVPHNALHDARALRKFVLAEEEYGAGGPAAFRPIAAQGRALETGDRQR